ncbi:hypothetical protein BT96DRAFT_1004465 [Gymnopus androsaceus JB14]|uniref:Uncharacterized protein n=1 Tax=Gymnopus androsaceus JB14 TaxID=1447944 RepID=A0A6A4GQU1_9AGAR|nr:hypothetical protein BT96DRAFT_1004465 [Gymnopus androsaceus JB14]
MYTQFQAYEYKKKLGWDFRLICVKVLGKKAANLAISPSKLVQKRTRVFLNLDSDEDDDADAHRSKRK